MNLKQWLDQERGRYTALAARLDVTLSRVSQMSDDGVPDKYKLAVRDFTGGVVSLESMVEARTPKPNAFAAEIGEIVKAANAPLSNDPETKEAFAAAQQSGLITIPPQ